jgi:tetrahydromethanopterin S-methyltransferase subunit C
MIAFGSGVIAMLFATKYGIAAPIVAVILAAIIGAIIGFLANNVLNMRIPVMIQSLTEMAIIGALVLMGYSAMMTGSFTFASMTSGTTIVMGLSLPSYQATLIGGGLIATVFMLGAIAVQHPFNACLGPSWTQDRMLMLAVECGFLSMITAAVMSMALIHMAPAVVSLVVAIIGWYYTFYRYIELSKRDAASWLDSKPIPELEGQ